MNTNRGENSNDGWLTPLDLIQALGPFGLDPCCPAAMPWRTARRMLTIEDATSRHARKLSKAIVRAGRKVVLPEESDGLKTEWRKVIEPRELFFENPPYSRPLPFVEAAAEDGRGIGLYPSKSMETRWAQLAISTCTMTRFLDKRISFCYPDGTPSKGAWSGYMLVGWGREAAKRIANLPSAYAGTDMVLR